MWNIVTQWNIVRKRFAISSQPGRPAGNSCLRHWSGSCVPSSASDILHIDSWWTVVDLSWPLWLRPLIPPAAGFKAKPDERRCQKGPRTGPGSSWEPAVRDKSISDSSPLNNFEYDVGSSACRAWPLCPQPARNGSSNNSSSPGSRRPDARISVVCVMQLVCFAGSVAEGQAHGCNPYIRIILYYVMLCYVIFMR